MSEVALPPIRVEGFGTCTPPPGITPQDAERLAREADELRKKD